MTTTSTTPTSTTPTLQFRRCSFEGRTFQHSFKGNGKITDKSSNEAIGKQSLESPGSNLTNPSKLVNVKKSSPDQTLKLSQMSLMRRCGRLISSEFTFASIDGAFLQFSFNEETLLVLFPSTSGLKRDKNHLHVVRIEPRS